MPVGRIAAIAFLVLFLPVAAMAQYQPPSTYIYITSEKASSWSEGSANVIQLLGPLTIETDRSRMTADRAVIWITPMSGAGADQDRVEIALFGDTSLALPDVTRKGESLFVTTEVRGTIRLTATQRSTQNLADSDLYRDATAMRSLKDIPASQIPTHNEWALQSPWLFASPPAPATAPTTQYAKQKQSISIHYGNLDTFSTPDDHLAAQVWNGLGMIIDREDGEMIQIQADRAVLFTAVSSLSQLTAAQKFQAIQDAVSAVYLEGDVRIVQSSPNKNNVEQRLNAKRVYYDLELDRAVLTDVVVHTLDPKSQTPLITRAHLVRQLSRGEIQADGAQLSISSFKTPSYEIYADRAYVRQTYTGDPRLGERTVFESTNNAAEIHGVPFFYWPWAAGAITDRGMPLRSVMLGSGSGFGPGIRTRWGLFESIGQPPPPDLDMSYRLDYFGDRGPGGGVDARYQGGFITDTSKQPFGFDGTLSSYIVHDDGTDRLSHERFVTPQDDVRYQALWQHQQFIPGDWQLQLRAGVVSDPTFLEEWFKDDFYNGPPHDLSAYIKRQRQTEALTLGASLQPSGFVTTADMLQEGFEVERMPELGYYRIGDALGQEGPTFFSSNTASALNFETSSASLADLGFRPGQTAGLPSLGNTGTNNDQTYRGDFRQEVDYPFDAGHLRVVPYVFGRYTGYSDSPVQGAEDRIFFGTGVRLTTAFWKVDDTAISELFDVHRVRHVVEPEVNLFTSAQTNDRTNVFIFDEPVDAINDVSAVQLAINQRWQTKRGGPGQWRNVDFFTFRMEGNFFANQPNDVISNPQAFNPANSPFNPQTFRGLYFESMPEASIPRNGVNADALWRVSDNTAVLYEGEYNLDRMRLATTSLALAAQRDARMAYYVGASYIGPLNSTIASFTSDYQLTSKYTIRLVQSFSLSQGQNQNSSIGIIRRFDRYLISVSAYYDAIEGVGGFRFGIYPEGLGYGISTDQVEKALAY